jgi:flavodoxin
MARPTKYKKELEDKSREYIRGGYKDCDDVIPSHVGLCKLLSIDKSTLYDWAKDKNKQFSNILAECNAEQERILITKGLTSEFNSNIVKLALGKHGYSDKQKIDAEVEGTLTINVNR